MADPAFDRAAFERDLSTRFAGRTLVARAEAPSTNDVAWEALAAGSPDGTVVVADAQPRGRGRAGRSWHMAPGRGLALSLVLHQGRERRQGGLLPLLAGLALARGLETLGLACSLKWPNDLLVGPRKLAGILCESRRGPSGTDVAVIGVGVNVSQRPEDFPAELRDHATSLGLEGRPTTREAVAARFLNALEPLWDDFRGGAHAPLLAAWRERAGGWGRRVTVSTPVGRIAGVARDVSPDGGLVLRLDGGREVVALAGDLEVTAGGKEP